MIQNMNPENLKILFGIKVKSIRTEKGMSLKELSKKSGIAVSYISEIESGKKYPKPEKLLKLAEALGAEYDSLVSSSLDASLDPFYALINSELIKQFPFHLFGISARDILGLFKNNPLHAEAFFQTFLQLSRAYDMSLENFLFAALRTFQRLHNNYFPDLEETAERIAGECSIDSSLVSINQLKDILVKKYGYSIEEENFSNNPMLRRFRSILRGDRLLCLNDRLFPSQKRFILAREIGYQVLGIPKRPLTSSWLKVEDFDQLVNHFKASYFGGALLIPQQSLAKDMRHLFAMQGWRDEALSEMLERYRATPEMLFYRMSQVLPGIFGLNSIFYMRFTSFEEGLTVKLTKELNMTHTLVPYGLGVSEHYCRRWLPLRLLKDVRHNTLPLTGGAQRIRFAKTGVRFLLLSMARPLSLASRRQSAIAIGFKIDEKSRERIQFMDDPDISEQDVGETCERCPLTGCTDRVADPSILNRQIQANEREKALQEYLREDPE